MFDSWEWSLGQLVSVDTVAKSGSSVERSVAVLSDGKENDGATKYYELYSGNSPAYLVMTVVLLGDTWSTSIVFSIQMSRAALHASAATLIYVTLSASRVTSPMLEHGDYHFTATTHGLLIVSE